MRAAFVIDMTSRIDRRRFLRGAATAGVGIAAAGTAGAFALTRHDTAPDRRKAGAAIELQWLGVSGWRIDLAGETLLIDPYLTRYPVGLATGAFDSATPLRVDPAAIDPHIGTPKRIFVTHTHWDHFNDVPHIATSTGARVHGTLTTCNIAQSMGVPAAQLSTVKGGEVFDFGTHTMEVISSLHSRTAAYGITFPGVRPTPPERPATIADLPEGDTLTFHLSVKDGPSVFFMGASDFAAHNLEGVHPDIAMIAVNSADTTHAYLPRLLAALGNPATVIPVHWDNFESPLQNPPPIGDKDLVRRDAFVAAIHSASPDTKVVIPEYLTPYRFD